jgi:hypothetical protein
MGLGMGGVDGRHLPRIARMKWIFWSGGKSIFETVDDRKGFYRPARASYHWTAQGHHPIAVWQSDCSIIETNPRYLSPVDVPSILQLEKPRRHSKLRP